MKIESISTQPTIESTNASVPIGELFPAERLCVMVGSANRYRTSTALRAAVSFATGVPLLDYFGVGEDRGKTLLLVSPNRRTALSESLAQIVPALGADSAEVAENISVSTDFDGSAASLEQLQGIASNYRMIVIDDNLLSDDGRWSAYGTLDRIAAEGPSPVVVRNGFEHGRGRPNWHAQTTSPQGDRLGGIIGRPEDHVILTRLRGELGGGRRNLWLEWGDRDGTRDIVSIGYDPNGWHPEATEVKSPIEWPDRNATFERIARERARAMA